MIIDDRWMEMYSQAHLMCSRIIQIDRSPLDSSKNTKNVFIPYAGKDQTVGDRPFLWPLNVAALSTPGTHRRLKCPEALPRFLRAPRLTNWAVNTACSVQSSAAGSQSVEVDSRLVYFCHKKNTLINDIFNKQMNDETGRALIVFFKITYLLLTNGWNYCVGSITGLEDLNILKTQRAKY